MIETISLIVMIIILSFFAVGSFYLANIDKESDER
jgi:hypothetical protein|tara:strand:- start:507 stop:611 length:105 start_codon:yes stop_codon:yes gene_type:complete